MWGNGGTVGQRPMVWSTRQRGPKSGYFYRSVRVAGKPMKVYMGRGPIAEMAALLDERKRDDRAARRAEQFQIAHADLVADEAWILAKLLGTATLLLSDCYSHKGTWRRRGQHGKP